MATRAERQRVLEGMGVDGLEAFQAKWGGTWFDRNDTAKAIASVLRTTEKKNLGDDLDHLLGLPTDAEQQLDLQRRAIATSESSTQASWLSAHAAVVSVVISLVALVVAVIALVVALQTKQGNPSPNPTGDSLVARQQTGDN